MQSLSADWEAGKNVEDLCRGLAVVRQLDFSIGALMERNASRKKLLRLGHYLDHVIGGGSKVLGIADDDRRLIREGKLVLKRTNHAHRVFLLSDVLLILRRSAQQTHSHKQNVDPDEAMHIIVRILHRHRHHVSILFHRFTQSCFVLSFVDVGQCTNLEYC